MNLIGEIETLRKKEYYRAVLNKIGKLVRELRKRGIEKINIMHVCGTHEHTITYYGIRKTLPDAINLIAGPGCPVCIAPSYVIDNAIKLTSEGVKIYTFGDMVKVPGSKSSLLDAKANGGDVEIVFGFLDAIKRFKSQGVKEAVFLGVGFETTAPTYATRIAKKLIPNGLTILTALRITVPATRFVLNLPQHEISGVIAPGHVSVITGANAWRFIPKDFNIPVVVAGFEPIDVIVAIYQILDALVKNEPKTMNEYSRVVTWEGNKLAQKYISEAFEVTDGDWRGIGVIEKSAWEIKTELEKYDAEKVYNLTRKKDEGFRKNCKCADIILGLTVPTDCPLFGKACTPEKPYGPCMVSIEGTCHIWYKYGGYT